MFLQKVLVFNNYLQGVCQNLMNPRTCQRMEHQRKMRFFEMYWSVYKLCSNLFGEWVCFVDDELKTEEEANPPGITVCSTPNKWYLLCWVSMTDDYCIAAWSSNIVAPSSKVGWSVSLLFLFSLFWCTLIQNCAQNAKFPINSLGLK